MNNISSKYRYLLDQDRAVEMEGATFRVYKDRSFLGKRILESLNAKRDGVRADGHHGFYLSDENKDVGLMSQLFGASGLFALINRYNAMDEVFREGSQTDRLLLGISRTVLDVLDYVEVNGYDMNPYIDKATNDDLFVKDPDNHYIGAMTWALSLFTAAVRALRNKTFQFRFGDGADSNKADKTSTEAETENLKLRLYKQIKRIVTYFIDNYIEDHGKGFGWGYCRGCEEPSLFFTYSVIEAYSDFEDNVMPIDDESADKTEWDTELLNYLNSDLKEGEKRLEERYRELCYKVGDKTWDLYKKYLRTQFFSEKFNGSVTTVSESEIRNTSRSTALFNTLYIIFILFYSSTNIRKVRYDGEARSDEELQEVVNAMTRGLQLVQNFYSDLKSERLDSIVDKHILSFTQKNSLIPDFAKLIGDFTIQASPLLPMLVKANNLIAYWVLKFPQQTMTELFDEVLEAKNEDAWLWEKKRFDLLSTERYLEAIADYFDYYDTYERSYAAKVSNAAQLRQEITKKLEIKSREALDKQIARHEKENEDRLKKERERLRTEIRTEVEENIRSEYLIEPQIEKKIAAMFDAKAEEFYRTHFIERLAQIANYNSLDKKLRDKAELPEDIALLKKVLEDYFRSYFADAFKKANVTWEDVGAEKFEKSVLADFEDFVMMYMGFASENADRFGNTLHLSKVFDVIKTHDKKRLESKNKDE